MPDRPLPVLATQRCKPALIADPPQSSGPLPVGDQIVPGAITVRPTRKDAEQDINDFYTLLHAVRRADALPHKRIADAIEDTSSSWETNISRRVRERSFSPDQRLKITRAIFDEHMTPSGIARTQQRKNTDALYFAFLNFMGIKETSQDKARARAMGTWKFFRHSYDHEGEFVLGRVDIYEDPHSHALKVEMFQQKKAQAGIIGAKEQFEGYFFRLANSHLMLLHDPENEDVRLTHFTSSKVDTVGTGNPEKPWSVFAGKRKHLVYLRGVVSGTDGNGGLFSPVEMVLVKNVEELKALDEQLDVIPSGDPRLPPRVEAYLNRQGKMRRF